MLRKRLRRLPSPALVVAGVALFVALGGTSYAFATGSITSREIKNGTIRNVDIKKGTIRGQEMKRDGVGGGAIKEQSLDGMKLPKVAEAARAETAARADVAARATAADTAARAALATAADGLARQLVVNADGTKAHDRGVVAIAKTDTGRYQVVFDRDVRACALSATLVQQAPPADAPDTPVTGEIAVAPLENNANGVQIATAASDGRTADRSFHLIVSC